MPVLMTLKYKKKIGDCNKNNTYRIVLFTIALNSFYFRPKTIRKQQTRLNKLIAQLKD